MPDPTLTTSPPLDPVAGEFVDGLLRQIDGNTSPKILRLALLMAYTAGHRDAVHAEVDKAAVTRDNQPGGGIRWDRNIASTP